MIYRFVPGKKGGKVPYPDGDLPFYRAFKGKGIPGLPCPGYRIEHFLHTVKHPAVFMNGDDDIADFLVVLGDGRERVFERK